MPPLTPVLLARDVAAGGIDAGAPLLVQIDGMVPVA